jgi:hypothetical protein
MRVEGGKAKGAWILLRSMLPCLSVKPFRVKLIVLFARHLYEFTMPVVKEDLSGEGIDA